MLKSATLGLAVLASGLAVASPAAAYDPCRRATERAQDADAAVYRWINQHCTSGGQCVVQRN